MTRKTAYDIANAGSYAPAAQRPFVELLQPIDPKFFASRQKWEIETTKRVLEAGEKTVGELGEAVQDAKENRWWGFVYENGIIAPFGLANYLAELYSFQIFLLEIWPVDAQAQRRRNSIPEFTADRNAKLQLWLKTKYQSQIKHFGFFDLHAVEPVHISVLKNEFLKSHFLE